MPIIGIDLRNETRTLDELESLRVDGMNVIGPFTLDGNMSIGYTTPEALLWESGNIRVIENQAEVLNNLGIKFIKHLSRPIEVCSDLAGVPYEIDPGPGLPSEES